MAGGINTYVYALSNPISNSDSTGLNTGLFIACEVANAAYTINSAINTLKKFSEGRELLMDQLERVDKEISECPSEDIERFGELNKIRNDLVEAITEDLGRSISPETMMSMRDVGAGVIRAGACGLLLLIP